MNDERWQRLQELFEAASRQSPRERERFLDLECADDAELRGEVESLLQAGDDAGSFFERAVGGAAGDLAEDLTAFAVGRRIGHYKILKPLAEGGMGVVYLAQQTEPVKRQVALKVIKPGMDTKQVVARFEAERQALAVMDHPNIAKVFDGGATSEARPYFAMEYVRGVSLTEYCDVHKLSVRERLELFRTVCQAVQHAHQKGVIHRDVKPSNILVSQNGKAVPKVIDFGIAKAMGVSLTEKTLHTQQGIMIGTPAYMSPEQAEATGLDVDTRTDIYSLGVVLYELLAGELPFDPKDLLGMGAIVTLRETQPPTPSDRFKSLGDRQQRIAERRRTDPRALSRRLKGDLDWIVMKAMEKDRSRRYETVNGLAMDIRRHLEGEPVVARPPSTGYRLQKFVMRNKVSVLASAAVLVALVAGAIAATVGLVRATRAEAAAEEEAETARQVSEFLVGLFEVSDPGESRGEDVTAQELLDRGAERVERALAHQPKVQAAMMGVIGRTYQSLGLYEEATPLLESALDRRREFYGPDHLETASSVHDLAGLIRLKGDYARAESLWTETLTLRRARLPADDPAVLATLNSLGLVTEEQGDVESAEAYLREALDGSRDLEGEDREITATVMSNLGALFVRTGRYEEAETLLLESLAFRRELHGEDHPDVGITMNHLARSLRSQGRYDEAEAMHREQIEWGRRVLGDEHPNIATWLNNLASVLKDKGEYAEAETIQREVLAAYKARLGDEHPLIALAYNNLANLRHDQGDFEEAEYYHSQALALNRKLYGDKHFNIADNLNNIAALLGDKGEYARAAEYQRQVLVLDRELLGEKHEYVALDFNSLGTFLMDDGQLEAAEESLRQGHALAMEILGPDHPSTATCAYGLARLLAKTGRYAEAEALALEVVRVRREKLPEGHWATALAETLLGESLAGLGRYEEAEQHLAAGYAVLREKRLEGDRYRAEGRERFVKLYQLWDLPDRAAALPY